MIEEATPLVVRHDEDGAVPLGARAHGMDHGGDEVVAHADVGEGVLVGLRAADVAELQVHEGHVGERADTGVGEESGERCHDR